MTPFFHISLRQIILFLILSTCAFAQQKPIKHKVKKGETVFSIARKYNIAANEIFKLNENSNKILKVNTVLLIPNSENTFENTAIKPETTSEKTTKVLDVTTHVVLPKETLFGIAKKYKVSIDNLKKWNPTLENATLEIGQKIIIQEISLIATDEVVAETPDKSSSIETKTHKIARKETKFGIAKKYNISVQELEMLNPAIKKNFPIGYVLVVANTNNSQSSTTKSDTVQPIITAPIETPTTTIKNNDVATQIIRINDSTTIIRPIIKAELANELEQRATENIGTRYRSGGTQPGGFDCSGLIMYAFENSGIKLPRTSFAQSKFGTTIDKFEAQKGDLIFFSTKGGGINHVGMVLENINGEIKFIHAAIHSGVTISSTNETYYQRTFRHINRVLE